MADYEKYIDIGDDNILVKNGVKATKEEIADLKKKKLIGIFFGAYWCLPSIEFSPNLTRFYCDVADKYPDEFEIIFASSDHDQKTFEEYFQSMLWWAFEWGDPCINDYKDALEVAAIPTLVVFQASDGRMITNKGDADIAKGIEAYEAWKALMI